jgi:hypothetical protein
MSKCRCTKLTADGQISDTSAVLVGILAVSDDTNKVDVIVYNDAAATAGKEVGHIKSGTAIEAPGELNPTQPIVCPDGIYINLTTAGTCEVYVYWN